MFSFIGKIWIISTFFLFIYDKAFSINRMESLRKALFKIQVISTPPDYKSPWLFKTQKHSSGTGFYIGNHRILTNAHVVSHAHFITIQQDGEAKVIPASVEYIAHDCDLAILTTKDTSIFTNLTPITWGDIPKLRSPVSTVGFPTGGEQLSVTKGVVSRIGYRRYAHTYESHHLLVQVDSAINPGNSGGPIIQDGKVIGVAFQSHTLAENTGYMIPIPIVSRFLKDIEDGIYDGHPEDGIKIQKEALSNPATAAFHGLKSTDQGIKIAAITEWSSAKNILFPGDVLLKIDDKIIDFEGKIELFAERIHFKALFDLKQIGETVTFSIIRGSSRLKVAVPLKKASNFQYSGYIYTRRPKYMIVGGLVFSVLTRNLLASWGSDWYRKVPVILKYLYYYGAYDESLKNNQDFVVLIDKLPHPINSDINVQINSIVKSINGQPIYSFQQFANQINNSKSGYIRFDFIGNDPPVVLPVNRINNVEETIKKIYRIQPLAWFSDEDGAIAKVVK